MRPALSPLFCCFYGGFGFTLGWLVFKKCTLCSQRYSSEKKPRRRHSFKIQTGLRKQSDAIVLRKTPIPLIKQVTLFPGYLYNTSQTQLKRGGFISAYSVGYSSTRQTAGLDSFPYDICRQAVGTK